MLLMKKDLARILGQLIKLNTTTRNYEAIDRCYQYLIQELSWYPFHVKTYVHNQIKSVVWSTQRGLKHRLILSAHLDVVPGKPEQFKLREKNGTWLGRGVLDMKFALAVFIVALKTVYRKTGALPPLAIMITSDEEIGGLNGVNYLVNTAGYRGDIVLIPDGGEGWHLVQSAKGVLHLTVSATGKSCHASEPWHGKSAIDSLIKKLTQLRRLYPEKKTATGKTTLVLGTISGGKQTNQVADLASATIDIRHPASVSSPSILRQIKKIFGKSHVVQTVSAEPFVCDPTNPYVSSWIKLISTYQTGEILVDECGASDGRYFSALNTPVILTQPKGGGAHSDSEHINISSVLAYTKVLINWLKLMSLENLPT